MGLFDRVGDQNKASPKDLPREEQPYSLRPSPQGWRDSVTEWPRDKMARFEVLFPYPSDAVTQLESHLRGDLTTLPSADQEQRLDGAFIALQALRMGRRTIPEYKGTYGAFLAWAQGCAGLEELLQFKLVASVAEDIGDELKGCDDPDLSQLGRKFLAKVLHYTKPGQTLEQHEAEGAEATNVQEIMFRRVSSRGQRRPPPATRYQVSGLARPERAAAPVDSSEVISLDKPVDRIPEPVQPGPGRRAAAAKRSMLQSMAEKSAAVPSPEAAPASAFPRSVAALPGAKKMTAQIVFQTLLEECLKDGKLTPMEMRALGNIRKSLGLDLAGHEQMLRKVQKQLALNPPEETEDLDPLVLFERLCWQAADDHTIDAEEQKMLGVVAGYLHISAEEFATIREKLLAAQS